MAHSPLGRTLLIANPAAHSGKGAAGADFARHFLGSYATATSGYEVRLTTGPGDAVGIAAGAVGFDTVLALGGDGVIHEVVNGLMRLPGSARPQLGVIPLGSGNDYARTLGMARNDVEGAFAQLVRGTVRELEVGRVNASQEGEALFVTSGLKILSRAKGGFPCTARFDGEGPVELKTLIFAVQVGPTYGGGFRICPDADPGDGLLDVCYNVKKPPLPHLLALFGLARGGRHARSSVVSLRHIRHAVLDFAEEPPCQVDGERMRGAHFEIDVIPSALRVVC